MEQTFPWDSEATLSRMSVAELERRVAELEAALAAATAAQQGNTVVREKISSMSSEVGLGLHCTIMRTVLWSFW